MWLVDMQGRICAQYSKVLSEGYHSLNITMSHSQIYLLRLRTKYVEYSAKLMNLGEGGADRIVHEGFVDAKMPISNKKDLSFEVQLGDEMQIVGYTNKEGVPIVGSYHVMSLSERQTIELVSTPQEMPVLACLLLLTMRAMSIIRCRSDPNVG